MLLGPIFSVELVTGARRTRYFIVRVLYGVILLIALGLVYQSHFDYGDPTDIGRVARFAASFFSTFTILQLLAVVALAPAMAAGTIASERERRTIEYLFVSHLTNAEIVFGKLAARLVQIGCLVLVGLPVLSLAGLLGGIAPEALVVAFILTLSTAVCVSVLSISLSVWSARARDAVVRAYLVMLCILAVPPIAAATLSGVSSPIWNSLLEPVNEQFLVANPFWILNSVLWAASAGDADQVQTVLGALIRNHLIISAVALVSATLAVRYVHLRARPVGTKRRFRLAQRLRPQPGNRPMLWKELFAEPGMSRLGWIGRIAMILLSLAILGPTVYQFVEVIRTPRTNSFFHPEEMFLGFSTAMATVVACGALLLVAARSAASVTSERERDSWTSLLSTPMSPRNIVVAKVLGSIYTIRIVFLLLAAIWVLQLIVDPGFLISQVFVLATLLLIAFAISSLGVVMSLWCKTSLRSMAATIAIGLLVGGGYLFCCMMLFIAGPGPDDSLQVLFGPCIPFLLAFPAIVYHEGERMMRHEGGLFVGYMMGLIFYFVGGWILISVAISNFDRFCGRTGTLAPPRPPRLPLEPTTVVPEIVEEEA